VPSLNARQFVPAALVGLFAHALAFCTGWLTGKVVTPSPGGGFEDLAAVVVVFILTEGAVLLGAIAGAAILGSRGRRDAALGLIAGWLVGAIVLLIVWKAN
jgi:RsiW-degrading membrane proteinase PrsW (M82 family)